MPSDAARTGHAALGLRVKTARAVAVALAGDPRAPEIALRRELSLRDPALPASGQPYHAALGLSGAEARAVVERASDAVRRVSLAALQVILAELGERGLEPVGVALVRASDTDPATIRNPHMHAHAAEGRLFHDALAQAAATGGLPTRSLLQKHAASEAARMLGRRDPAFARAVATLGKRVGPPWRADEKSACAGAWLVLAQAERRRAP